MSGCGSQLSFTTSFSNTAQFIVTGLAPGTYQVTQNDQVISPNAVVSASNNTLYFEASSGTFTLTLAGTAAPLAINTSSLPNATSGVFYAQALAASGGAPPYTWSISAGSLPAGLSLSSDGVLAGTPGLEGRYQFTVQVSDSAAIPATVQTPISLVVVTQPESTLAVAATAVSDTSAIIHYGMDSLDANQRCTIDLSTDSLFLSLVSSYTDTGGAAWRDYFADIDTPLTPSTNYYVRATCGSLIATNNFSTLPTWNLVNRIFRMSFQVPTGVAVSSVLVEYGFTPSLGSQVVTACSGTCSVELPTPANRILYLRRTYRDGNNQALASSSIQAAAGPR